MRLKLLRLLAVVVSLAVPIQGLTAVTAGQCMALGHHQDASQDHQGHAQEGHDGNDHAAHSHPEAAGQAAGDEPAGAHCGPCTACCASASISGPLALSMPSDPVHPQYHFSQFPPVGVQPDGLDRPPLAL